MLSIMMTNNIFFIVADVNIHSVKKKMFNDFLNIKIKLRLFEGFT